MRLTPLGRWVLWIVLGLIYLAMIYWLIVSAGCSRSTPC